jgi:aldose 1-epimerase
LKYDIMIFGLRVALLLATSLLLTSASASSAAVATASFGQLPDGRAVTRYTLVGAGGFAVELIDYGASIVSIRTPDRAGKVADVALGFPDLRGYLESPAFFGAVVGRVANRIAEARFMLDGKTYTLAANNSPGDLPCSLHGGVVGFDKVLWRAMPGEVDGRPSVRFEYLSRDGEEGFPGNLTVSVTYSLTADHGLRVDYAATTDAPTPVALSNHAYFNLRGEGDGDVLDHELTIRASRYTPVNRGLIPTGEFAAVESTPFDFRAACRIGERIATRDEQLGFGGGYDHNFVIDRRGAGLELMASVYEPQSGRVMEILSTEPGLQFYSGNFLDGKRIGKAGGPYGYRGAFVLETQHFPNAVNEPRFPSVILRPGERYESSTVFRFTIR